MKIGKYSTIIQYRVTHSKLFPSFILENPDGYKKDVSTGWQFPDCLPILLSNVIFLQRLYVTYITHQGNALTEVTPDTYKQKDTNLQPTETWGHVRKNGTASASSSSSFCSSSVNSTRTTTTYVSPPGGQSQASCFRKTGELWRQVN